jgi:putative transposase
MKYDPKIHHRRSIRIPGYDTTQPGAYFITINTWHKQELFGEITDGKMTLNEVGEVARKQWARIPQRFPQVELGEFVVMPDHLHGIIIIVEPGRGTVDDRGTAETLKDSATESARRALTGDSPAGSDSRANTNKSEQYGKPVAGSIGTIIRSYKSAVSLRLNLMRRTSNNPVWQRNYFEHIIRDEKDLQNTSLYIQDNPLNWKVDEVIDEGYGG